MNMNRIMTETIYDLCIIGAGMYGSAAARHASANVGVKVCLVGPDEPATEEKMSRQIFGAHYDEGRIVRILDDNVSTKTLTKLSVSRFRELEELSGIQFYHPVGCLHVSVKNSTCSMQVLHTANITDLPVVDLSYNDIFQRRFPFLQLKSDDQPLLEDTGSGHISPRNIVAAQKKVALLQGCHIVKDVVNEVTTLKDNIHEVKTEKGKVLKSKRILICTGAFTNLKNFPIPKLKIDIFRESAALIKIPLEEAERLSSMPTIIYYRSEIELGAYILPPIQYQDGNFYLKIGHMGFKVKSDRLHTLEEIRDWYLSKGDTERVKRFSELLISMLPGLKYEEVIGLSCASCENPSDQPYIDRVSPTVTVAVVGNGRGAKISEEVGRIAAHLSLTGQWDSQLSHNHFKIIVDKE